MSSTSKTKPNCRDQLNQALYVTKTRQDNNVIDYTNSVYAENDTDYHDRLDRVPTVTKTK